MGKYQNYQEAPKKQAHRDYELNLRIARQFCEKVRGTLPSRMRCEIRDGEGIPNALLMVSWQPPRYAPIGNYANAICLHQSRADVAAETKLVYEYFIKKVGEFHVARLANENLFEMSSGED